MSIGVPRGSDWAVQPFLAVAAPVPEQGAAWPRSTFVASAKQKFAVHCAPSVKTCTPGWIVAVAAGAHVGAAEAETAPIASAASAASRAARDVRRRGMADLPETTARTWSTTH